MQVDGQFAASPRQEVHNRSFPTCQSRSRTQAVSMQNLSLCWQEDRRLIEEHPIIAILA